MQTAMLARKRDQVPDDAAQKNSSQGSLFRQVVEKKVQAGSLTELKQVTLQRGVGIKQPKQNPFKKGNEAVNNRPESTGLISLGCSTTKRN
jgi:hypothetical protein